ncbi:MAG: Cof-type HAD-IIB family hydrolase [Phycisphaeraceae bacterium]|nr:Cof-type HAD-IIB family hydrolase [Phycisphaeraceae bacterium]
MLKFLKKMFGGSKPPADSPIPEPVPQPTTPKASAAAQAEFHYGLVAIDIDGTLLRSDGSITVNLTRAVQKAQSLGVRVILSSARTPDGVLAVHQALNLNTLQISFNGALICNGPDLEVVYHKAVQPDTALEIAQIARKFHPKIQIRADILDKWFTDTPTKTKPGSKGPTGVLPLDKMLAHPVSRLTFLTGGEPMNSLRNRIRQHFSEHVAIQPTDPRILQLVNKDAHKGKALEFVSKFYNVERDRVMAIGDAPNDIAMINWAGCGVAMGNAWKEVHEVADLTVASNNNSGVTEAIRDYVLSDDPFKQTG